MESSKKISVIDREGRIKTSLIPKKGEKRDHFAFAPYLNIGFYLVTPILLGVFLGTITDSWLKTKPLFILLFIIIGTIASFYNLIRLTKDASHKY